MQLPRPTVAIRHHHRGPERRKVQSNAPANTLGGPFNYGCLPDKGTAFHCKYSLSEKPFTDILYILRCSCRGSE